MTALADAVQLSAEVRDQHGQVLAGATVTWASSSPSVATVNASGLVTAVANGEAGITATAGSASESAAVTVAQVVSAVSVTPRALEFSALCDTLRLAAEAVDANGYPVVGAEVAWRSGNASVAEVDSAGLVRSAGNGEAGVTATAGSASDSALVTVAQVAAAVTVTPPGRELEAVGDTLRLWAEAFDANGNKLESAAISWMSGDSLVATVDSAGLVRAFGNGETVVTAATGKTSGNAAVNVKIRVTITLTPRAVTLSPGDSVWVYVGVSWKDGGSQSWWFTSASADTSVAGITSALLVARSEGETVVTVTAHWSTASGTANLPVTVTDRIHTVTVSPAADSLHPGDTIRIEAEARDADGEVVPGVHFQWNSSDYSVAHVDTDGLVTALSEGKILVTARAGGVEDTARIVAYSPDRAALVALYRATGGPFWDYRWNWLTDRPLQSWFGVRVNKDARVVRLHVAVNNLRGTIPPELGSLPELFHLSLEGNDLVGTIPPELGNLSKLENLQLDGAGLTGTIPPQLGNLSKLKTLNLDYNALSGPIPREFGNLSEVQGLYLSFNRLTGPIPRELGNLSELDTLDLRGNKLTGRIPEQLGNLSELRYLWLNHNELSGRIPPSLLQLGNLVDVHLQSNNLSRAIPEIGDLPELEYLLLHDNDLEGPVPSGLGGLSELRALVLSNNALTGSLPSERIRRHDELAPSGRQRQFRNGGCPSG